MALNASREDKDRLGYLAYVKQALREAVALEPIGWTVTSGGSEERTTGISASIANAAKMGVAELDFHEDVSG